MSPESMCGAPQPERAGRQGRVDGHRPSSVHQPTRQVRRRIELPAGPGPFPSVAPYGRAMAADLVVRAAGPDPSVTVYPRRGMQVLVAVGSAAFVAGSIWLLTFDKPRAVVAGVLGIVVFGLFAVLAVRLVLRHGPALVIDTKGITDRSSAAAAGFVPWHQVTGLSIWEHRGQRIVCVAVMDPALVLAQAGGLVRLAMRVNIRLTGTPVTIATTALPFTPEQLIKEIAAFAPW
jgi:hypothetical protein